MPWKLEGPRHRLEHRRRRATGIGAFRNFPPLSYFWLSRQKLLYYKRVNFEWRYLFNEASESKMVFLTLICNWILSNLEFWPSQAKTASLHHLLCILVILDIWINTYTVLLAGFVLIKDLYISQNKEQKHGFPPSIKEHLVQFLHATQLVTCHKYALQIQKIF